MTWIIKRDDPEAPADDQAAWVQDAGDALRAAVPGAHPFLVALLAARIAALRARDGQEAARRFQNYCTSLLRRPGA